MEEEKLKFTDFLRGGNQSSFALLLLKQNKDFIEEIKADNLAEKRPYGHSLFANILGDVKFRDVELVKFLLDLGCNPNDKYLGDHVVEWLVRSNGSNKTDGVVLLLLQHMKEDEVGDLIKAKEGYFVDLLVKNSSSFKETFKWFVDKNYLTEQNCKKDYIKSPELLLYFESGGNNNDLDFAKVSLSKTYKLAQQFLNGFGYNSLQEVKEAINFFKSKKLNEEQKDLVFSVAAKYCSDTNKERHGMLLEFLKDLKIDVSKKSFYLNPAFGNEMKGKVGTFFRNKIAYNSYSVGHDSYFYLELLKNDIYCNGVKKKNSPKPKTKLSLDIEGGKFDFLSSKNEVNPREKNQEHVFDIIYTSVIFLDKIKMVNPLLNMVRWGKVGLEMKDLVESSFFDDLLESLVDNSVKGRQYNYFRMVDEVEGFCDVILGANYVKNTKGKLHILELLDSASKMANIDNDIEKYSFGKRTVSTVEKILSSLDADGSLSKVDSSWAPICFFKEEEPEKFISFEKKMLESKLASSSLKKVGVKI